MKYLIILLVFSISITCLSSEKNSDKKEVIVKKGETLSKIVYNFYKHIYKDKIKIRKLLYSKNGLIEKTAALNNIKNKDIIKIGQIISFELTQDEFDLINIKDVEKDMKKHNLDIVSVKKKDRKIIVSFILKSSQSTIKSVDGGMAIVPFHERSAGMSIKSSWFEIYSFFPFYNEIADIQNRYDPSIEFGVSFWKKIYGLDVGADIHSNNNLILERDKSELYYFGKTLFVTSLLLKYDGLELQYSPNNKHYLLELGKDFHFVNISLGTEYFKFKDGSSLNQIYEYYLKLKLSF